MQRISKYWIQMKNKNEGMWIENETKNGFQTNSTDI